MCTFKSDNLKFRIQFRRTYREILSLLGFSRTDTSTIIKVCGRVFVFVLMCLFGCEEERRKKNVALKNKLPIQGFGNASAVVIVLLTKRYVGI